LGLEQYLIIHGQTQDLLLRGLYSKVCYNTSMKQKLQNIIQTLKANGHTITMAESCTGGRIAAAFTSIAGSSAVFHGSCVTYANEIKHLWLGVSDMTLREHGAVSEQCVQEMLSGIRDKASSDYAIAVSGIAGPDGGSEEKPVGTVYIGLLTPTGTTIERHRINGDREAVQRASVEAAISLLEKNLKKS
jgi:nicotinamide-nucleotide amidase